MNSNRNILILAVFMFAIILRLWNFTGVGRTTDEVGGEISPGYRLIALGRTGNFSDPLWWNNPDDPPLDRYLYGVGGQFDFVGIDTKGNPIFTDDLFYSRLVSVFFSSLAVMLVTLLGWEFVSPVVGVYAGIILAMLPFFLGFSQIATRESLIEFFFTLGVYLFIKLVTEYSLKKLIIVGIVTGLAVSVKPTNAFLVPVYGAIFTVHYLYDKTYRGFILWYLKCIIYIVLIAIAAFIAAWPMVIPHFMYVWNFTHSFRFGTNLSIPEVFFGKLHLVPKWYYIVMFFITTPSIILLLFLIGLKDIVERKKWLLFAVAVWFFVPFLQSFYHFRQHGVRYIIEIYAPLSIIAGIGFDYVVSRYTNDNKKKSVLFLPVVIYLFLILLRITPYYIDYFNILVGGAKGVYENRSFQLGWWGEGNKEAIAYLEKTAEDGSTVGVNDNKLSLFPVSQKLKIIRYNDNTRYDYVVVEYYNILREGFNDGYIKQEYTLVNTVKADGAVLVYIYKRR